MSRCGMNHRSMIYRRSLEDFPQEGSARAADCEIRRQGAAMERISWQGHGGEQSRRRDARDGGKTLGGGL